MKRLILMLILMLALTAGATDLFSTYASVRQYIRTELGYSSSSTGPLSDSLLNVYIRIASVTTNPVIQAREVEKSILCADGQNHYTLDSLESIISVEWAMNDSVKSLLFVPRELWHEQSHKFCKAEKDNSWLAYPSYFDYSDSLLFVHPPPDRGSDTIKILGVERTPDIDTASTLTRFPRKYRVAIAMRATADVAQAITSPKTAVLEGKFEKYMAKIGAATHQRGVARVPAGN